ncbi:MAG: hypothetical protein ACP5FK_00595 [bacterium]
MKPDKKKSKNKYQKKIKLKENDFQKVVKIFLKTKPEKKRGMKKKDG